MRNVRVWNPKCLEKGFGSFGERRGERKLFARCILTIHALSKRAELERKKERKKEEEEDGFDDVLFLPNDFVRC